MTRQNINSIYKEDKKIIKKDYKDNIKKIKKQRNIRKAEYESELISQGKIVNPPKRSVLEEVGNAISHGLGSVFSILAFILLILKSNTLAEFLGCFVYSFGLLVMFTISCLYHSFKNGGKTKRLFRRFDYLSIYLLIGGTFAPILLCYVGGIFGYTFFIIQWLIITLGITLISIFGPHKLKALHLILYLLLGWCGLLFIPTMLRQNFNFFYYILGGGIIYSLGIIPFALKKKASHFIWHFFVLGGAIVQFIGIYLYIYLV